MLVNRKFDAFVVVLVVGFIGFVALRPQYRLRADAPPEFLRYAESQSPQRRAGEEKIARAFWKCAVTDIQWRYGYGYGLPPSPPPEFAIARAEFGPAGADAAVRARYWENLQEVWYMRRVWNKEYGFQFRSFQEAFESAGNWLQEQTSRLARH